MNEAISNRLTSLDVFRGLTIAAMVLVNNPGSWSAVYPPLKHAEWHGWTPTDMIFPFFVFIVGVSISLSLGRRVEESGVTSKIVTKIFVRSGAIFLLGLIQMGYPFFDLANLRIPGVLQRLALCYLFAALIFLFTKTRGQVIGVAVLTLGYWALMYFGANGDYSMEGNFSGYVDRLVIPVNHLYKPTREFYDPEGLLSTMPAIASCLIGVLCGNWIRRKRDHHETVSGLFVAGIILTFIGWVWNFWFPINKPIWTSSYVMYMGGLALCFLGLCYWLIDVRGGKWWTRPFEIFGTNALALYFGSAIFTRTLINIKWDVGEGKTTNVQKWFYDSAIAPYFEPINASLVFAILYILLWLFLMWLLYRKKIFIKV